MKDMRIDDRRMLADVVESLRQPLLCANQCTFEMLQAVRNWDEVEMEHIVECRKTKKEQWRMQRILNSVQTYLRYSAMEKLERKDKVLVNRFCRLLASELEQPVLFETDLPDYYTEHVNEEALWTVLHTLLEQAQRRMVDSPQYPDIDWIRFTASDQAEKGMLTFTVSDCAGRVSLEEAERTFMLQTEDDDYFTIERLDTFNCWLVSKLYNGLIYIDPKYTDGRRVVINVAL